MSAPYVRDGMVHVPLPDITVRELLWRCGHGLAMWTDEAATSLIGLAESDNHSMDGWYARAAAITDAPNVHMHLTADQARTLARTLTLCADRIGDDDDAQPVFRMCGGCQRLRPDAHWGTGGTRCIDCYEREMEIHRDHAT